MTDTTETPRYTLTRQNGVLAIIDRQEGLTLTEEKDGDVFRDYLGILFGASVELALAMETTPSQPATETRPAEVDQALHDLLDFLLLDHPEVIEHSKYLQDAATAVLEWVHGKITEVTP